MFLRKLTIQRYRGIQNLEWCPEPGMNCLIGPGDSGKSTVLNAIGLLLDPRYPGQASEYDYYRRRTQGGFEITAVLGAVEEAASSLPVPLLQGWKDGKVEGLPDEDGAKAVLVMRVAGNADLEITHSLMPPSGDPQVCSSSFRQRLAMARIGGLGQAFTEFRLGRGTLLEKHLGQVDLRAQISEALAKVSEGLAPPEETKKDLETLAKLFADSGIPADIILGVVTPPGSTLMQTVALMIGADAKEAVPLGSSGKGTKQMAMYILTRALAKESPIVILDEPEAGLEPYRQRSLIEDLRRMVLSTGQSFLTTHSPAVVSAMAPGELWHLRPSENPARLIGDGMDKLIRAAPDALLSRLPVLCEGITEIGFLDSTLNSLLKASEAPTLDSLGIRLVDGGGQPKVFGPSKALLNAGVPCGLFVDNEEQHSGSRKQAAEHALCAFGSWDGVCNVEEAATTWLPWEKLPGLIELAARLNKKDLNYCLQAVSVRLGQQGRESLEVLRTKYGEPAVRNAIGDAAHEGSWFKEVEHGRELGKALVDWGLPDEIRAVLEKFLAALRLKAK